MKSRYVPTADPGTPPLAVQQQAKRRAKLLEGEIPSAGGDIVSDAGSHDVDAAVRYEVEEELVDLQTAGFSTASGVFEIGVLEANIGTDYIALLLPPDAPRFAPKGMLEFELILQGNPYPVIYIGGDFDFPRYKLRAMGFLRNHKVATND